MSNTPQDPAFKDLRALLNDDAKRHFDSASEGALNRVYLFTHDAPNETLFLADAMNNLSVNGAPTSAAAWSRSSVFGTSRNENRAFLHSFVLAYLIALKIRGEL